MSVEIIDRGRGPWASVECGAWRASVFGTTSKVILTLRTAHGNVTLQHDAGTLLDLAPKVYGLYGLTLDADALRNAIEAGKAALVAEAERGAE